MKNLFLFLPGLLAVVGTYAQTTNFSYVDPAQAVNKLVIEKNSNSFYRIGNYRVIGSPFLYGGGLTGTLYRKDAVGVNGTLSYNTYDQTVEFVNGDKVTDVPEAIDSFKLLTNDGITNLFFYSGKRFGLPKTHLQLVYQGAKASLYKRYFSELDVVSTNIVESDLREFGLNYEYVYVDWKANSQEARKIKPKYTSVIKEFKAWTGLKKEIPENFNDNPEANLIKAFKYINEN